MTAVLMLTGSAFAQQRVLTYNADYDPIPLAGMEALIADFEAANPDIDVQLTNFDHEGYKTAIRNFLTTDPPDLANWYAGNRMAPFVNAGQFTDVTDVWEANGLNDALSSAAASMTISSARMSGLPGCGLRRQCSLHRAHTAPRSRASHASSSRMCARL
jgi:multiple sugar transport system substrate-binding protein